MEIGNIVKLLLIAAVCLLSVLANGKKNRALRRSRRKVRLLSALANGKKKKPRGTGLPLPQAPQEASHPQAAERKRPLGFAIPHLKGAPPQPPAPDDDGVYREQAPRAAGEQACPSAAPAQPVLRGRVLGDADVSVDDAGVMREPGVLASEAAERLREQMADAARAEAYALARRAALRRRGRAPRRPRATQARPSFPVCGRTQRIAGGLRRRRRVRQSCSRRSSARPRRFGAGDGAAGGALRLRRQARCAFCLRSWDLHSRIIQYA